VGLKQNTPVDPVYHNCDNCGNELKLNSDQRYRQRKDPKAKFYCDHECHMEDREKNRRSDRGPWAHLNVNTVLHCLPSYEEGTEIGLGA